MTASDTVDLSDFSLWRNGFPDELFAELRRDRPIFQEAAQVLRQRFRTGVALARLFLQTLEADRFQVARDLRLQPGRRNRPRRRTCS